MGEVMDGWMVDREVYKGRKVVNKEWTKAKSAETGFAVHLSCRDDLSWQCFTYVYIFVLSVFCLAGMMQPFCG